MKTRHEDPVAWEAHLRKSCRVPAEKENDKNVGASIILFRVFPMS